MQLDNLSPRISATQLVSVDSGSLALGSLLEFSFNPITLRKAKIVYNFGLSECNRFK